MPLIRDGVNSNISYLARLGTAGRTPATVAAAAHVGQPSVPPFAKPNTPNAGPTRGSYPPSAILSSDYATASENDLAASRFGRSRVLSPTNPIVTTKASSSPATSAAPSAAVQLPKGTPLPVTGFVVSEVPRKLNGQMVALVTAQWSAAVGDPNYVYAQVWAQNYHGSSLPQLVASGRSPVTFSMDATNETATFFVFSVSGSGLRSVTAPTAVLVLSPTSGAPPAPTVSQTLVQTNAGYQFQFNQEAGLLTNIIGGYNIYRNTVNNSSTASKISYVKQSDINAGVYTFQDSNQPVGQTYFYWVSAVDILGEESALTSAQSGTIVGVAVYPMAKLTGFQMLSNPDFEKGLAGINGAGNLGSWQVYDNNNSGSVVHSLVADNTVPNGTGQKLKIVEASVGAGPTPGLGGFFYTTQPDTTPGVIASDSFHVGDTYFIDLLANIPVGYTLNFANNSLGTGGSFTWLSSQAGTGTWQHYISRVIVGTSPFNGSAFPFFYLTGVDGVTWYVGQMQVIDGDQTHRHAALHTIIGNDGTKFGHGVGLSGTGVGHMVHAGNIRTYLNSTPNWGFYGTPGMPVDAFAGAYVFRGKGGNPSIRMDDTNASGRNFGFASGTAAGVQTIDDITAAASRTQLNSAPQWGFFGSPGYAGLTTPFVHVFGSPVVSESNSTTSGVYSPGHVSVDDATGGRVFFLTSGGYAGLGHYGMADVTANAGRTVLTSGPAWGFYGTPGSAPRVTDVQVFGSTGGENSVTATGAQPGFCCNDTGASGLNWGFNSGVNIAGAYEITQPNIARRVVMNNSPNWGWYGTPGAGVPVHEFAGNPTVRLEGGGVSSFQCNDTDTNGRNFAYESGRTAAGIGNITDLTAGTVRTQLNSSPQWGWYGAPSHAVEAQVGVSDMIRATGARDIRISVNSTNTSEQAYSWCSGFQAVGTLDSIQEGVSRRTTLTTSPQWGFFGSPGMSLDIAAPGASGTQYARITNSTTGDNTGWRAANTGTSGRDYGFLSAFPGNANQTVYDFTAGVQRTVMDASGNQDFGGSASPSSLSAGGVTFSDLSGNLNLKNKNIVNGSTAAPTTTSGTYAVIPEMTTTITTKGNKVFISFYCTFTINANTQDAFVAFFRDGSQISGDIEFEVVGSGNFVLVSFSYIDTGASAASHTFDIRWKLQNAGATMTAVSTVRSLEVVELG